MTVQLTEKQKKNGWQIVKFAEIAKNVSKRVDPTTTDLKVYVGLEHLDPQSLRIQRKGVPGDVKGQKLRVRPGQIIFGKRRAYQKKLAIADFDGICSAHAMVLEEIPGKIIPGLLPFLMQSDMFMDRAVAISEGSLSPTIKWKSLAVQEFPLPPLERQKEILEVLEKVEELAEKTRKTLLSAIDAKRIYCKNEIKITYRKKNVTNGKVKWLSELCTNLDNQRIPIKASDRNKIAGVIPYYGASGIIDYVNKSTHDGYMLLVSEDGANLVDRNTPIAFKVRGACFVNNHAHVYRPPSELYLDYLEEYFSLLQIRPYLSGTAQPKLTKQQQFPNMG